MAARPPRKKVVAVCKTELAPFMYALGIDEVIEVSTHEDLEKTLDELSRRGDVGVILVQASLYRGASMETKSLYPIVTPFPAPNELALVDPEKLYKPLIRRYVGVEVRLPEGRESG